MARPHRVHARNRAFGLGAALWLTSLGYPLTSTEPARAQGLAASESPLPSTAPTALELETLARSLGSPDRATRRVAFENLSSLAADALPAISGRLSALQQRGFDREGVLAAWSSFRRVQGVEAPEAPVDLAKGALLALEQDRKPGTALGAELIALLRALEAQKSPEASEVIVGRMLALDSKLLRYEAPRIRERLSVLLIPALIRHQTHPKPWVRAYCQESLAAMAITSPGRAVQQDDVTLLAAILQAYGDTLTFDAMPVVVSYLTDERLEVQNAARKAVARFGRNAIWQIRERYLNATGKEADPNWGHQRILSELYKLHDAPKQRAFDAELKRAELALDEEKFAEVRQALDRALQVAPGEAANKRTAPLFAKLGEEAMDNDELEPALDDFRRALRLDPGGLEQNSLRARIAYLEGELRLSQGVLDLTSFQRALELDPGFAPAEEALDELTGERSAREQRRRNALGFVAAALMAIAGFVMLRRGVREERGGDADGGSVVGERDAEEDAVGAERADGSPC